MSSKPREALEELLELLWTAEEDGLSPVNRRKLPESLRCFQPHPIGGNGSSIEETVETAITHGLVCERDGQIHLTPDGRSKAEPVVRRHRLTESLLAGVLDISEDSMESTACQMEHILNAEVTEAVCAFLGHPPICPHGRSIPRGLCCVTAQPALEPLISPLAQLSVGEEGRVAFIHTRRSDYRQRLSLLGLIPGTRLKVRRLLPTLVVAVGETELALDREAGREIFVRRRPNISAQ